MINVPPINSAAARPQQSAAIPLLDAATSSAKWAPGFCKMPLHMQANKYRRASTCFPDLGPGPEGCRSSHDSRGIPAARDEGKNASGQS
jgi:hypothetical protein